MSDPQPPKASADPSDPNPTCPPVATGDKTLASAPSLEESCNPTLETPKMLSPKAIRPASPFWKVPESIRRRPGVIIEEFDGPPKEYKNMFSFIKNPCITTTIIRRPLRDADSSEAEASDHAKVTSEQRDESAQKPTTTESMDNHGDHVKTKDSSKICGGNRLAKLAGYNAHWAPTKVSDTEMTPSQMQFLPVGSVFPPEIEKCRNADAFLNETETSSSGAAPETGETTEPVIIRSLSARLSTPVVPAIARPAASVSAPRRLVTAEVVPQHGSSHPLVNYYILLRGNIVICNNMLFMMGEFRRLRLNYGKILWDIVNVEDPEEKKMINDEYEALKKRMDEITKIIHRYADNFSLTTPELPPMQRMLNIFALEEGDGYFKYGPIIEMMMNKTFWNEIQFQSFGFYSNMLTPFGHQVIPDARLPRSPLPPLTFGGKATDGHNHYMAMIEKTFATIPSKKHPIWGSILVNSTNSSVVELLFAVEFKMKPVYIIKFLLVEKWGAIEYISVRAPHEAWDYDNPVFNQRSLINPFAKSKMMVYQMLTTGANIQLRMLNVKPEMWEPEMFLKIMGLFSRARDAFSTKCCYCKANLRTLIPPTRFDLRGKNMWHDLCQPGSKPKPTI